MDRRTRRATRTLSVEASAAEVTDLRAAQLRAGEIAQVHAVVLALVGDTGASILTGVAPLPELKEIRLPPFVWDATKWRAARAAELLKPIWRELLDLPEDLGEQVRAHVCLGLGPAILSGWLAEFPEEDSGREIQEVFTRLLNEPSVPGADVLEVAERFFVRFSSWGVPPPQSQDVMESVYASVNALLAQPAVKPGPDFSGPSPPPTSRQAAARVFQAAGDLLNLGDVQSRVRLGLSRWLGRHLLVPYVAPVDLPLGPSLSTPPDALLGKEHPPEQLCLPWCRCRELRGLPEQRDLPGLFPAC